MIVAGIGCRTGVGAEAVVALVHSVMRGRGRPRLDPRIYPLEAVDPRNKSAGDEGRIAALAVPEFRQNEPGITEAAKALGLPILWIARAALKGEQGRCLTRSARAEAETGLASVAEAAALAAAGPDSRLVLPRIAGDGVTCALAEGPGA